MSVEVIADIYGLKCATAKTEALCGKVMRHFERKAGHEGKIPKDVKPSTLTENKAAILKHLLDGKTTGEIKEAMQCHSSHVCRTRTWLRNEGYEV